MVQKRKPNYKVLLDTRAWGQDGADLALVADHYYTRGQAIKEETERREQEKGEIKRLLLENQVPLGVEVLSDRYIVLLSERGIAAKVDIEMLRAVFPEAFAACVEEGRKTEVLTVRILGGGE